MHFEQRKFSPESRHIPVDVHLEIKYASLYAQWLAENCCAARNIASGSNYPTDRNAICTNCRMHGVSKMKRMPSLKLQNWKSRLRFGNLNLVAISKSKFNISVHLILHSIVHTAHVVLNPYGECGWIARHWQYNKHAPIVCSRAEFLAKSYAGANMCETRITTSSAFVVYVASGNTAFLLCTEGE